MRRLAATQTISSWKVKETEMAANDAQDVVRLATARNPAEAHLMEQALQAEGIACHVVGDFLNAGLGDIPGLRAEVWVHRQDLARAEGVLQQIQTTAQEPGEHEPEA
jgi:putative signal transducing protein